MVVNLKKSAKKALRILAVTAVGMASALANTVVYNANVFSPYTPGSGGAVAGWDAAVSLPKFNPAAFATPGFRAVLTGASVQMDWYAYATLEVTNFNTTAQPFALATASVPITITGSGAALTTLNVSTTASVSPAVCSGPFNGYTCTTTGGTGGTEKKATTLYSATANGGRGGNITPTLGAMIPAAKNGGTGNWWNNTPSYGDYTGVTGSGTKSGNVTASGLVFYTYYGSGSTNIDVLTNTEPAQYGGSSAASHVDFGGTTDVNAKLTITYTYSLVPIPEPATSALLGSALLGIGLALRRR